jgi:hypothetical protein
MRSCLSHQSEEAATGRWATEPDLLFASFWDRTRALRTYHSFRNMISETRLRKILLLIVVIVTHCLSVSLEVKRVELSIRKRNTKRF